MRLTPTTKQDIDQLSEWINNDPYHKDCLNPLWWLTGNGILSYCIQDSKGPTMYVRLDKDNDLLRLHCQFAPESEVSRLRVAKSLIKALPMMKDTGKTNSCKGYVYKSTNPELISFMEVKFGFTPVGSNDDYWLPFEVEI